MTDQVKYTQQLKGANVLVIGGSAGLGYGVAEAVLEEGGNVTISSSNQARVDKAVASLKKSYPSAAKRVVGYAYSMGDEPTLESNIVELLEKCGKGSLDHIVYTAGDALAMMPIAEVTMEKLKQAGMVRYFGPVMVGKHAPKYLKEGPASSIILTTGSVSQKPRPNWSAVGGYATALHGLTRGLAYDLAPLRVNLISPGGVDTELWASMPADARAQVFESMAAASLTGKIGSVADVTQSYLYCMKDKNATGAIISTSSGALLK